MIEPSFTKAFTGFADAARGQRIIDIFALIFNLRRLGLFASGFLILGIIFLFIKLKNLNKLKVIAKKIISKPKLNDKAIRSFFVTIDRKFKENNMLVAKLALAEVENYFDKALEEIGFKGKSLTDKLETIQEKYVPNIEQIKVAHKQVQGILDTDSYPLTDVEAKGIIQIYIEGLENLKKL